MSRAVSPELVLVDPDLARAERERLLESARLALLVGETRVAASSPAARAPALHRRRETVASAVALVSVAANIVLASVIVAREVGHAPTRGAVPVRTSSVDAAATTTKTRMLRTAPRFVPGSRAARRAAERHVFEWLARTPQAALPKALAGAGRPGGPPLGVRCLVSRAPRSYRCSLRVGGKRLGRTLVVQYPAPAEGGALIAWAR